MNRPDTPRSLGAAIRERRQELGWSQEHLAALVVRHGDAAFRQSDVSRLELGKVDLPHRQRLAHIAAVLQLSPGELLERSGWNGASAAFTAADHTMPLVARPPVAPVVDQPPVAVLAQSPVGRVHARIVPLHLEEFSRLRAVLTQAEATRARTQTILAQCKQIGAWYERPVRERRMR